MKRIHWAAMVVAIWIVSFSALSSLSPSVSAQTTLVVDDDGYGSASDCDSSDVAYSTIQAAIDAAAADDIISVCPGTYNQDEANGRDPDTGGAGSNDFNIFVGKALTIQGVDASGTPITDYDDVAAHVIAKRQLPTFGQSAIFVQADGVTITGLEITGWSGTTNNKTVEVVGDDVTIKDCVLHGLDSAAALYFDDRHFNSGTMTSHVQSYHVEENLIDGGGPNADGIRISSGAGWSGDVSGRVIADNVFDNTIDGIAFVGPGADPWDVYPVGDATITGNSFSRSDRRHVIAWGTYGGGLGYVNLDWQAIVNNNTFDKAAITWTPGGDARPWSSGSFVDIRGIYSAIQRYALNKAQNGDTIQVLPGLYAETLNIEGRSDLSIVGDDRDTVIVKPTSTLPWNVGGYGTSRQAAVRVVSSTGISLSNMTFDFDTVKGNLIHGVLYWDSTGTLSNNVLKNMSVPDLSGGYYEITSYIRAPSYSDGARASVVFSGNEFRETGRLGIVTHDFVNATIQGNTFTKTTDDFGYAMEIGSRSTATVTGNTISGYDTPAASDGSTSAGIYIENSFTGGLPHINKPVTISDNEVTGNQYGVWIGNEWTGYAGDIDIDVTFEGNNIHDNLDGGVYIVDEGRSAGSSVTVNASGNDVINNGDVGYYVNTYGDGELHVDVRNDTITGHAKGVLVEEYPSGPSNSLYDLAFNLNDLSGNTTGAENTVAGLTVDATGNWWGNASGPYNAASNPDGTGAAASDNVAYSPWLGIGTDTSGNSGFQPASPMTFIVEPQVCLPVGCIQQGVNLASDGDTIQAKAGTYDEQVIIGKSLTLQGSGDTTVIKPSSAAKLTTVLDGHWWGTTKQIAGIVVANVADGSGVTVKNLKVDGQSVTAKPAGADYVAGIFYRETAGTVDGVTSTNVTVGATGTAVRGYGMYLSAGTNAVSVEVKGSSVTNYDKNGIEADGSTLTANIHDNTVTGRGPLPNGDEVQNGIVIGDGAVGTVNNNTVTDNFYTPETWWASAIMFFDAGGSAEGNTISGCQIGVIFQDGNASASDNTVTGGKVGAYAQYTKSGTWTASFADNTVSGSDNCGIGGATYAEGASLTLTIAGNALTGGTGDGVCIGDLPEYGSAGSVAAAITANTISDWQTGIRVWSNASTTVTRLNRITGNGSYGVRNTDSTGDVDAKSNWWGDVTGPYHATKNPTGLGDDVSDYVLFDPWVKGIEYVGDTSIPVGSVANLRARFVNSDGTSPAVAGIQVYFDVLTSGGTPVSGSPFSALTQSSGVASAQVSGLGVDVYTVKTRWDPLQDSDKLGVFGPGDSDGDGITDPFDNCPTVSNPDQTNTDNKPIDNGPVIPGDDLTVPTGDGYGDACDDDDDNDWLTDTFEAVGCGFGSTNPLLQDTDGDRVVDGAECLLGSNPNNPNSTPSCTGFTDNDGDCLPANVEAILGSSDSIVDSDGDGISDPIEVMGWGTSPTSTDTDGDSSGNDGCRDDKEIVSINDDGVVDSGDVLIIRQRAAKVRDDDLDPDPPWNFSPAFDLNKDGYIDSGDVLLVRKNSGAREPHSPCQ